MSGRLETYQGLACIADEGKRPPLRLSPHKTSKPNSGRKPEQTEEKPSQSSSTVKPQVENECQTL